MAAWNIKEDDRRIADSIQNIIIFCEDEASEILYLKTFETSKIKINLIGRQKSDFENVLNAIHHCQKNGLMVADGEGHERLIEGTFVWCVYDRDIQPDVNKDQRLIAFDESIQLAERKGFKVAWSNDAFELWILIHLEDINPTLADNALQTQYYLRLTQAFLARQSDNVNLKRVQAEPMFSYKNFLKDPEKFSVYCT